MTEISATTTTSDNAIIEDVPPPPPPSAEYQRARGAYNGRQRLFRVIGAARRDATAAELALLDSLLERASPGHWSHNKTRFIGMHAVSMTRDALARHVDDMCLVQHKVDGLGALCAFLAPPAAALADFDVSVAWTAFFIRRHGQVDALAPVLLPKRYGGRVLLDGELCLRKRRLSYAESQRFEHRERHYLDYDDGDPRCDSEYELCYAAHDCLVADDLAQSTATPGSRTRLKPAVATLDYPERVRRLYELSECKPVGDTRAYEAIMGAIALIGPTPLAVHLFAKQPLAGCAMRLAFSAPPMSALRGVPLDGIVITPSRGSYTPGTNVALIKCKERHDQTLDVYVRRVDGGGGYAVIVRRDRQLVCVSSRIWFGAHEQEIDDVQRLLALAFEYAAGAQKTDLVIECRPHLTGEGVRSVIGAAGNVADAVALDAAARTIYWQPIGTRPEKHMPNAYPIYQSVVESFVNYVSPAAVVAHVEQCKQRRAAAAAAAANAMALDSGGIGGSHYT